MMTKTRTPYQSVGNENLSPHENSQGRQDPGPGKPPEDYPELEQLGSTAPSLGIGKSASILDLVSNRVIIGNDDREPSPANMYPYNCIALLVITDNRGNQEFGTGFFIAPRCVITAGHCVFLPAIGSRNAGWARSIEVIPGALGSGGSPFGRATGRRFRSVKAWAPGMNDQFDYGAVILDDDQLYQNVGAYFGFEAYGGQKNISISGYPDDPDRTQMISHGRVTDVQGHRLFHSGDTLAGNSGSPLYIDRGDKRIAIGIHTGGDPDAQKNWSIKVNQHIVNRWAEWSKL